MSKVLQGVEKIVNWKRLMIVLIPLSTVLLFFDFAGYSNSFINFLTVIWQIFMTIAIIWSFYTA